MTDGRSTNVRTKTKAESATAASISEVVEAARVEAALEPIVEKTIPRFSFTPSALPGTTFWMLQKDGPPWPWDPLPDCMVYPAGSGHWLVDDRAVDWPGLEAQLRAEAWAALTGAWRWDERAAGV